MNSKRKDKPYDDVFLIISRFKKNQFIQYHCTYTDSVCDKGKRFLFCRQSFWKLKY